MLAFLNKLNGWQRLWVMLAILWLPPVVIWAYNDWPNAYTATVAGCVFSDELFSPAIEKILNDELSAWRQELASGIGPWTEYAKPREQHFYTLDEFAGIPGWKGDPIGEPKWARAPLVEDYCPTLMARLERSGRANELRQARNDDLLTRRLKFFATTLAIWVIPLVAVYLLGVAVAWIIRGFRSP